MCLGRLVMFRNANLKPRLRGRNKINVSLVALFIVCKVSFVEERHGNLYYLEFKYFKHN